MAMDSARDREILEGIAERVMRERGLWSEFSPQVQDELDRIDESAAVHDGKSSDLTRLLWASIDNDDSRDLDQLTVAEALPGDVVKIRVAVADVDSRVKLGTAIDAHARHNTTSVYTAGEIFPMLPEKLSTDLTSLNPDEDRLAIVVEMHYRRRRSAARLRPVSGAGAQPRQAGIQQRGRLAGGHRRHAPGDCRGERAGGEPAAAGQGGAEHEELPARPRRAQPGDHRGAPHL